MPLKINLTMNIISLTSVCHYISPKLREGLNEQENFVKIDNGLNSPYFTEIWTKATVL